MNYAYVAYEFLSGFVNLDSIPDCIEALAADPVATMVDCAATEADLQDGVSPDNPFLIRIVPGLEVVPGHFQAAGYGCCDLEYVGPISNSDPLDPAAVVAQLNDMLDTLWGIALPQSRPTQVSSQVVSGGQPYVEYNQKTVGFDSVGVGTIHPDVVEIVDTALSHMYDSSLTLSGGLRRLNTMSWQYYQPLIVDEDSSTGRLGAFDGSSLRLVDSTSVNNNLWRTYGPIQMQFTYGQIYEGVTYGPVRTVLGWELKPSSAPGDTVMGEIAFEYWHNGVLERVLLSVADTSSGYLAYLNGKFTTQIGKFVQVDEHTIGFSDYRHDDITNPVGLRPWKRHRRSLTGPGVESCLTSFGLCEWTPGCDVCIRWDTLGSVGEVAITDVRMPKSCEQIAVERLRGQLSVAYGKAVRALRARIEAEYRAACLDR